jgi:hypothetical protein
LALLFFAITLFISAFLLFLVQPIIGKMILPKLGGTPQVWNTCMVFFQTALLAGYFYTHAASTYLNAKKQIILHGLLLFVPLLLLLPFGPFGFIATWTPLEGGNPIFATLWVLTIAVGVPFFVVATSAPLLQKWFAATGHPAARDPYFLYGASNLGSMLALIAYPALVEPNFGLGTSTSFNLATQSWLWAAGYIVLIVLVLGCGAMVFLAPPQVGLAGAGGRGSASEPDRPSSLTAPTIPEENATPAATTTPPGPADQPGPTGVTATPPPPAPAPKPGPSTAIKRGSKQQKKHRHQKQQPKQQREQQIRKEPQPRGYTQPAAAAAPAHAPSLIRQDEVTPGRRLRWVLLAAVPSSMMLGVTTFMSEDVSAIPLFWVIPLALYLLSFILVFMRWPILWLGQPHTLMLWLQPVLLGLMVLSRATAGVHAVVLVSSINLLAFLATALVCHGELARDRPSTKHLTEFYLWMSVGGMLGGMFNGLLAPLSPSFGIFGISIFRGVWEFPIAIIAAALVRPRMTEHDWLDNAVAGVMSEGDRRGHGGRRHGPEVTPGLCIGLDIGVPIAIGVIALITQGLWSYTEPSLAYGIPLAIALCFLRRPLRFGLALAIVLVLIDQRGSGARESLLTERSYFGILNVRVGQDFYLDDAGTRKAFWFTNLTHGTTDHGQNFIKPGASTERPNPKPDLSRLTTTYYHRAGPVGMAMEKFDWFFHQAARDVGRGKKAADIIAENWNQYHSDARLPASLVGLGASQIAGVNLPISQLVGAWSEPPYATIGLGTGTMASYARPLQILHFYEIDSRVRRYSLPEEEMARGADRLLDRTKSYEISRSANPPKNYFTYLRDARARGAAVDVLMGDARLRMAQPWDPDAELIRLGQLAPDKQRKPWEIPWEERGGPDGFYHLIVVDAFSSDAIPVHLLTKEAVEMYMRKLAPGGVLCVHVSNRHLNLVPVVADIAASIKMQQYDPKTMQPLVDAKGEPVLKPLVCKRGRDNAPGRDLRRREHMGHTTSEWVMVARQDEFLAHLDEPGDYEELRRLNNDERRKANIVPDETPYWSTPASSGRHVWTDDYSNLMSVFRWPWARRSVDE